MMGHLCTLQLQTKESSETGWASRQVFRIDCMIWFNE